MTLPKAVFLRRRDPTNRSQVGTQSEMERFFPPGMATGSAFSSLLKGKDWRDSDIGEEGAFRLTREKKFCRT